MQRRGNGRGWWLSWIRVIDYGAEGLSLTHNGQSLLRIARKYTQEWLVGLSVSLADFIHSFPFVLQWKVKPTEESAHNA